MVFFGTSVAFRKKLHIGIDLLVKQLHQRLRWFVEFTAHLVLVVFFGYMVVYGVTFSIESYAQPTSIMRFPNTCFYSAVPASFALMLLYQTVNIVTHCRMRVAKS
jgi:TRAP-type C4-dicarboxylate transport system permease small subunit